MFPNKKTGKALSTFHFNVINRTKPDPFLKIT